MFTDGRTKLVVFYEVFEGQGDQRGALTVRVDLRAPRCPPQITARRSPAKRVTADRVGLPPPGQTFPSPIDKIFIYRSNRGKRIPMTGGAGRRPLFAQYDRGWVFSILSANGPTEAPLCDLSALDAGKRAAKLKVQYCGWA